MDSNSIQKIVNMFVKENDTKSLLIDGPWGCGKTYQITEYLRMHENDKYYYLSLFGMESTDEVNTALYQAVHPNSKAVKHGLSIISRLIKPVPYCGGIAEALEYQLSGQTGKIKVSGVIFFDDLERVGKNLSYISLLGYFNTLFLSGLRIVCIYSSEQIKDNDKKKDFDEFKEKIFDRICSINDANSNVIFDCFKDFKIDGIVSLISDFDKNLRTAQRTRKIYSLVENFFKNKSIDPSEKITKLQLLRCCLLVCKLVFSDFSEKQIEHSNEYEDNRRLYGENVAKGLYFFFGKVGTLGTEIPITLSPTVKAILSMYLNDNYNLLSYLFAPKDAKDTSEGIWNSNVYYLSDEHKSEYIQLFFDNVRKESIDFSKNDNLGRLSGILNYSTERIPDKDLDFLAEQIVKDCIKNGKGIDTLCIFLRGFGENTEENNIEQIKYLIGKINENEKKEKTQTKINKFQIVAQNKKYSAMTDFIYSFSLGDSDSKFSDYIKNNHFFLPDLSGDMTEGEWSYSHECAKFAKSNNIDSDFIDELKRQIIESPSSICLLNRSKALIKYNINSKYDFYILDSLVKSSAEKKKGK